MSLVPARFRWILLLSLALNLALGTYLIMRPAAIEIRGRGHSMVMPPPHVIARVLSPEGQKILDAVVDVHRPKIRPALRSFAAGRRAIQALLRAPDVDQAALTAAFAELRQREQITASTVQQMLIDLIMALPAHDRQQLAEVLDRPRRRGDSNRRERREAREAARSREQSSSAAATESPSTDADTP